MAKPFLGRTGSPEGRGVEAEEHRAATAQEMSPACRAREKRRRKRKYQNRLHIAIGETRVLRPRSARRWFYRQARKDANGGDRMCKLRGRRRGCDRGSSEKGYLCPRRAQLPFLPGVSSCEAMRACEVLGTLFVIALFGLRWRDFSLQ